jgi:hypothetical protein
MSVWTRSCGNMFFSSLAFFSRFAFVPTYLCLLMVRVLG